MATQIYPIGVVGDPNVDPGCYVNLEYNDVTDANPLLITGVQYKNTTTRPALLTWNGHSVTLTANTPLTVTDVSAAGEHMVQFTNVRGQQALEVPGGGITFQWPSP